MTSTRAPLLLVQTSVWAIGAMLVLKIALLAHGWTRHRAQAEELRRELDRASTSSEAWSALDAPAWTAPGAPDVEPCAFPVTPHPAPVARAPRRAKR